MTTKLNTATQCIHGGAIPDAMGSPGVPLYDTTTFRFGSTADLLEVVEGNKSGYLYTRYGMNPSIKALEARLALLDDAELSLAFASGMAAISALFLTHGMPGIVCVGDVYGGTMQLLAGQLPSLGIRTHFVDAGDFDGLQQSLEQGARLVFLETPANPTLELLDIAAVSECAHRHAALVAVDNTFASPINQKPLVLGADFAVQSATKYLGGHSDLTAGVLSGAAGLLKPVDQWRRNLGQMIAPEIAHKLARSLCTLPLRIGLHNENAMAIASYLSRHPAVDRVYYPGLPTAAGHALARKQMAGFGGMLSFDVRGSAGTATALIDRLQLIALAPSLGGVESLATQPVTTSHHGMPQALLERRGITGSMIRLSVGLENVTDLINDLDQALESLGR